MTTQDQQLAEQIVAELIDQLPSLSRLLPAEKRESVCKKLSTGQMKASDWRLLMAETLRSKNPPGGASPWAPV